MNTWKVLIAVVFFCLLVLPAAAVNGPEIDHSNGGLTITGSYHHLGSGGACLHRWYHSGDQEKGLFGVGWKSDFELSLLPDVDGTMMFRRAHPDQNGRIWIRVKPVGLPSLDFFKEVRSLAVAAATAASGIEGLARRLAEDGPSRIQQLAQAWRNKGYIIPGFDQVREWRGGGFRITRGGTGYVAVSHSGQFEFDGNGRLVGNGAADSASRTAFIYDSQGRLWKIFPGKGNPLTFEYRREGDVVERIAIDGSPVWEGSFDPDGRLRREKRPDGECTEFAYDPNGRINAYAASNDARRYTYDEHGWVMWVREDGYMMSHNRCYAEPGSFTMDIWSPPPSSGNGKGDGHGEEDGDASDGCGPAGCEEPTRYRTLTETRHGFTFLVSRSREIDGFREERHYNQEGLLTRHIQDDSVQERIYDEVGRLVEIIDQGRTTHRLAYADPSGRLAMIQTPDLTATYSYDAGQKVLLKVEHSQLGTMTFLYNSKSQIVRLTTSDGRRLDFTYTDTGHAAKLMLDGKPGLRVTYFPDGSIKDVKTASGASGSIGREIGEIMRRMQSLVEPAKEAWKL